MYTLVSIVGARPQFVKLAPLCRALAGDPFRARAEHLIVHTGQHYDPGMSDVFFEELEIPRAGVDLGIGSGPHGRQTGRMLERLETLLAERRPDLVIVYGDTNSTLAAALAAVKLHLPVSHLEAGLRSFNRAMPEEINRIVADHTSDQLLAPTRTALENLTAEGLAERTVLSGDIMHDAVLFNRELARERAGERARLGLESGAYGVVTVHRAENTDGPGLVTLLDTLNEVSGRLALVLPLHPRTAHRLQTEFPDWRPSGRLQLIEPVGYLDMLDLVDNAALVLTDSGGLQKEALFLGCPCVTLRTETEWLETVDGGANLITGARPAAIHEAVARWLDDDSRPDFGALAAEHFGAGDAAARSLTAMFDFLEART